MHISLLSKRILAKLERKSANPMSLLKTHWLITADFDRSGGRNLTGV